jgi:dienelactone hydrolase
MGYLQKIILQHAGKNLEGELAVPTSAGPHPAVLVVHNAFGIGSQVRETATVLAAHGYVALACDMYGDGFYSRDQAAIADVVAPLWGGGGLVRERIERWFELLAWRKEVDPRRIAVIGYCFGGMCALELARSGAALTVAISYHGILETREPARTDAIKAHVAVFTGAKDPHAPPAHLLRLREEMMKARASWQITEFGDAYHAFTEIDADSPNEGRKYDPIAHRVSWNGTIDLLEALTRQLPSSGQAKSGPPSS